MKPLLFFAVILALSACSPNQNGIPKTINQKEFSGVTSIGDTFKEVSLNYDLDSKDGKLIHFSSCTDIDKTPEKDIKEDQYQLFSMLKRNCLALKLYFEATNSAKSYLPASPSLEFIRTLPANAIPDQGGNSKNLDVPLGESQPELTEISATANSIEVQFNDLNINYVVLAKGDFNHNGIEDMLLRMDWRVTSAFGSGFELFVVEAKDGDIQVINRY